MYKRRIVLGCGTMAAPTSPFAASYGSFLVGLYKKHENGMSGITDVVSNAQKVNNKYGRLVFELLKEPNAKS